MITGRTINLPPELRRTLRMLRDIAALRLECAYGRRRMNDWLTVAGLILLVSGIVALIIWRRDRRKRVRKRFVAYDRDRE